VAGLTFSQLHNIVFKAYREMNTSITLLEGKVDLMRCFRQLLSGRLCMYDERSTEIGCIDSAH
jgi:hypothetical protein